MHCTIQEKTGRLKAIHFTPEELNVERNQLITDIDDICLDYVDSVHMFYMSNNVSTFKRMIKDRLNLLIKEQGLHASVKNIKINNLKRICDSIIIPRHNTLKACRAIKTEELPLKYYKNTIFILELPSRALTEEENLTIRRVLQLSRTVGINFIFLGNAESISREVRFFCHVHMLEDAGFFRITTKLTSELPID